MRSSTAGAVWLTAETGGNWTSGIPELRRYRKKTSAIPTTVRLRMLYRPEAWTTGPLVPIGLVQVNRTTLATV